ncbi:MAG: pyridoxine 5'-phosphate synthase [Verrucomicrobiota bacterium]|jgi:pyridoxine 5-phosphate synthase
MSHPRIQLGVNIDHAATLRQARYRGAHASPHAEPDVVAFTREALAGGADGITVHLREDRRHIQDADVLAIALLPGIRLNLEMACTAAMVEFACRLRPAAVCLVPESREEVTTEGGLDVAGQLTRVRETTRALKAAGIEVSLFIGPDAPQIKAAVAVGAPVVELHTGAFANAWKNPAAETELARLRSACDQAHELGLIVNAGHGINYDNIRAVLTLPHLHELNIGHSIVARSLFTGIRSAVAEMKSHLVRPA